MREPRKTREEIQQEAEARLTEEFLEKYHLKDIDDKDLLMMKEIIASCGTTAFLKFFQLTVLKPAERYMLSYLATMVKQNFIIIRKLDELVKKLDK